MSAETVDEATLVKFAAGASISSAHLTGPRLVLHKDPSWVLGDLTLQRFESLPEVYPLVPGRLTCIGREASDTPSSPTQLLFPKFPPGSNHPLVAVSHNHAEVRFDPSTKEWLFCQLSQNSKSLLKYHDVVEPVRATKESPLVLRDGTLIMLSGKQFQVVFRTGNSHLASDSLVAAVGANSNQMVLRENVIKHLSLAWKKFQTIVTPDLMPSATPPKLRSEAFGAVKRTQISLLTDGEFDRNFVRGEFRLGPMLLDALYSWKSRSPSAGQELGDMICLFILHEIYHYYKHNLGRYHHEIGRSDSLLETMDFEADGFAIATCVAAFQGQGSISKLTERFISVHMNGMLTFDRSALSQSTAELDCGNSEPRLTAKITRRRLQRYLIWLVQIRRAAMVTTTRQLEALLSERVHAILAPLKMSVGPKHEDLVEGGCIDTAFMLLIARPVNGELIREERASGARGFDALKLLEHVQRLVLEAKLTSTEVWSLVDEIGHMMDFLIEKHRDTLQP